MIARCPRCDAYDAWEEDVRRIESFGLVILEHTCGICHGIWRVPIPTPVLARLEEPDEFRG